MERTATEAKTSAEPVVIILRNFELTFLAQRLYVGFFLMWSDRLWQPSPVNQGERHQVRSTCCL